MSAADPVTAVLNVAGSIIERVFPNPADAANAKLELVKMEKNGELAQLTSDTELAKGQITTNTEEAKSESLFVAGWRPFVGWTCGLAFFFKYVGGPALWMLAQLFGRAIQLPVIDSSELFPVLLGMLGLGAYRSFDKLRASGKGN